MDTNSEGAAWPQKARKDTKITTRNFVAACEQYGLLQCRERTERAGLMAPIRQDTDFTGGNSDESRAGGANREAERWLSWPDAEGPPPEAAACKESVAHTQLAW